MATSPPDIQDLEAQLDAARLDANRLVTDLDEERGRWRERPDAWSVAECLDHLATANRVYLGAMDDSAARARREGRLRRGPAKPGLAGRCFIWTLEPPVRASFKLRSPRRIRPRTAPALADAFARFQASHDAIGAFLRAHADLDLAAVGFWNPFIKGLRFSLATGLNVLTAHERRHLWQAWRVRLGAERAAG